jgi:uncharacterized protein (AIM24 family)
MEMGMKFAAKGRVSHTLDVMLVGDETFRSPAKRFVNMTGNTQAVPDSGKLSGLKRLISSSFIPMVTYRSTGDMCTVTVGPAFPGEIFDLDVEETDWIVQKDSVIGAGDGVEISKFSDSKLADKRLGKDGLVLARFAGHGTAFVCSCGDGTVLELRPEHHYTSAVAHVVGWQASVRAKYYDDEDWDGVSLIDFKGPGKIILQGLCPGDISKLGRDPDEGGKTLFRSSGSEKQPEEHQRSSIFSL